MLMLLQKFMFITFVSIFALPLGVSLSFFLRIPIFIVICNGLATRDVRNYSKKGSWEYDNPNNVQRKGIFDLYFQDTTFPLSQKCQWPVHDCFVVRIFPFVKPFHTITQFFVHLAEVALPTNICWKEIPNKFWCYSIVCLLATTMSMAAQVWLLAHLSPHSYVLIRKFLPFEKNNQVHNVQWIILISGHQAELNNILDVLYMFIDGLSNRVENEIK